MSSTSEYAFLESLIIKESKDFLFQKMYSRDNFYNRFKDDDDKMEMIDYVICLSHVIHNYMSKHCCGMISPLIS